MQKTTILGAKRQSESGSETGAKLLLACRRGYHTWMFRRGGFRELFLCAHAFHRRCMALHWPSSLDASLRFRSSSSSLSLLMVQGTTCACVPHTIGSRMFWRLAVHLGAADLRVGRSSSSRFVVAGSLTPFPTEPPPPPTASSAASGSQ